VRHDPAVAHAVLAETIGHAEEEFDIAREYLVDALHVAVDLGDTDEQGTEAFREFFDRLLPNRKP
jgi:hypothetical protein